MKKSAKTYYVSVIVFLLLLPCKFVSSQSVVIQNQNRDQQQFIARIKQFSEFVDRFNYKTDFNGNPVDSAFSELYPREKYLNHLFDKEFYNKSPDKSELINKFISELDEKKIFIDRYSQDIIAAARTKISYNGESEYLNIYLNQELVGDDMVKWVILDVFGSVLDFMEKDTSHIRFISPASNETNFINLKRAMIDSLHLQDYAYTNYKYDPLSVFFYCLNKKIIKIDHIENLSYYIRAIPGWCFKIEVFNRTGYNSGWLISDLFECDMVFPEFLEFISTSY